MRPLRVAALRTQYVFSIRFKFEFGVSIACINIHFYDYFAECEIGVW